MANAKIVVARALCAPVVGRLVGAAFGELIPSRGCRIDTSSPLVSPQVKAMLFWRLYETGELRFIERFLRSDLDVVELGASLGVVGSFIGRRLERGRRLVCVEAHPSLVPIVEGNVRRNARPGVGVEVVHGAVDYATSTDEVSFFISDSTLGSGAHKDGREVRVPRVRLGELLTEHAIRGPYALVCDIEGSELGVLENEHEALARCVQFIAELHTVKTAERSATVEDLLALAERQGFHLRARHGPVVVLER